MRLTHLADNAVPPTVAAAVSAGMAPELGVHLAGLAWSVGAAVASWLVVRALTALASAFARHHRP